MQIGRNHLPYQRPFCCVIWCTGADDDCGNAYWNHYRSAKPSCPQLYDSQCIILSHLSCVRDHVSPLAPDSTQQERSDVRKAVQQYAITRDKQASKLRAAIRCPLYRRSWKAATACFLIPSAKRPQERTPPHGSNMFEQLRSPT